MNKQDQDQDQDQDQEVLELVSTASDDDEVVLSWHPEEDFPVSVDACAEDRYGALLALMEFQQRYVSGQYDNPTYVRSRIRNLCATPGRHWADLLMHNLHYQSKALSPLIDTLISSFAEGVPRRFTPFKRGRAMTAHRRTLQHLYQSKKHHTVALAG